MRILVLGGTLFLGRHIVDTAVRQGHDVSIFNRGRTLADVPPDVTVLRGDRDDDVSSLRRKAFDVVIDTSAYRAAHLDLVADSFDAIGHYILLSTASVYSHFPASEETAVHPAIQDGARMASPESYPGRKRGVEVAAQRLFNGRLTTIRAGVLAGPHDPTNRFEYWVRRCARGGTVLVPGEPERHVQLLDARDLAEWIVGGMGVAQGIVNAAAPRETLTMQGLVKACIAAAQSSANCVWVCDDFLLRRDVRPWSDLPLWVPSEAGPLLELDSTRAYRLGLAPRPLVDTARDVLQSQPNMQPLAAGMPRATPIDANRERELLMAWHRDRTS